MQPQKSLERAGAEIFVRESDRQKPSWVKPMELNESWREVAKNIKPSGLGLDLESVKTAVEGFGGSLGKKLDWVVLRELTPASWAREKLRVMKLERECFPPGYAFDEDRIARVFKDPESVILALEREGELVGLLYGGPLERAHFSDLEQVTADPHYGQENTFYGTSIAISERHQGRGLGRMLYDEYKKRVKAKRKPDGSQYMFLSGRARPDSILAGILERDGAELRMIPKGYKKTGDDMIYAVLKMRE